MAVLYSSTMTVHLYSRNYSLFYGNIPFNHLLMFYYILHSCRHEADICRGLGGLGEIYNLAVLYRVIFGLVLESTPCRTIQSQDTSRSTRALRLPQKTAGLLPQGSVNCLRLMHLSLSGHTENETPHQHPFAFRLSCSGHQTCK